jgi:PST family polysaccharide transporter
VQYSTLITNYGFSFSATRQAAVCQGDPRKLADIVSHVWAAKCLLMLACLVVSIGVFATMPSLRPLLGAYLCGFVMVVGNVLYLDWFFQAIEEMKWITIMNVVPKLALTPLIFVFVKAPADYPLVLLIQSAAFLASGLAGAALARRRLHVTLPTPSLQGILAQLNDGWRTFLATVSINLYTSTNIVILGGLTNLTVVGYYSAGQKVVAGVQSLWVPFSQSLYPYFCKSFHAEASHAARQLKRVVTVVFGATLIGACIICLAAPTLVPLYLGPNFHNSIGMIQVLIFSVCAIATSNLLGIHGMLASGLHGDFLRVVAAGAAANLLLVPLAILVWGPMGLAVSTVAVEVLICTFEYAVLRARAVL